MAGSMVRHVVLAGFALLLAGCSSAAPLPVGPADATSVESRAATIYTRISGDSQQRDAANYLEWLTINQSYWSCLEGKGFTPIKQFSPLWTGWIANPTSGQWMGSLQVRPSVPALAIAASSRAESSSPGKGSPTADKGYQDASDSCQSENTDVTVGGGPGTPVGAAQLTSDFKKLVEAVDAELGPIDDYRQCMAQVGIDYSSGSEGDEGWQGLYRYLTSELPQAPLEGEEPSQAWRDYLVFETKVLAADESCRGAKYHEGLRRLAPGLEDFASGNAARIDEVAQGWAATVEQARAKGFTG
jgi:hypothetical protein